MRNELYMIIWSERLVNRMEDSESRGLALKSILGGEEALINSLLGSVWSLRFQVLSYHAKAFD